MVKKNPSTDLFYKGKRINKFFKEAVVKTAQIKKEDISTPAKLKKFYSSNKEKFAILFEIGLETSLASTTTVFKQFDKANDNGHNFYISEFTDKKSISANRAKFELAKLEQQLNVMFGSTGVEYSYKMGLDGSITIDLPEEEELELLQEEPVEFVNDYLSNFGIKIYTSDESKRKKFIANEPRRKSYTDRVVSRFKEYRKIYNKERKKTAKGKAKRKKR
jgi:hypothetical protein